ncbi:oxidoreductase [Dissulfurispira thermophila]|uniref:Oxidoreductase n=1 Tax=Dissulfurispira thermophila TaxID=2715679 RepID=A0A7G1H4M6_9BACT|nr:complex I NDUFA9 subunit family protein [Dissulfurispira thermophila]BCB97102.1 oxidoreductase [Dissulfurispira thermophila]
MLFIAGGTGFIGKYLLNALSKDGYKVRCLVRTEEKAAACKKVGFDAVIGDITDKGSLKGKLNGCDILVHLVGIIEEKGGMTFEKVHVEGTRNLIDEAKRANIKHIFYQSALGASISSWAKYYKTKAEAEEIVRASSIPYTIFRPSLVVGRGDGFTEKLKELVGLGPFVPIPGSGNGKFQPIYVEDWVKCFLTLFSNGSGFTIHDSQIYEFGGPEHLTYNEIVLQLMEAMGINKPLVHIPVKLIKMSLPFSKISQEVGRLLGKEIPTVTGEQLSLLQLDNICDRDSVEKNFGFVPMMYREALRKFIGHNS